MIPIYTLAFSSCGVRYPLSPFKVALLCHFGVHFSQIHPLGFMRVVHFELSCAAVSGEPSIPLFYMFYKLVSDGDWFTFAKQQNSVSKPCYNFMPTSTYPKDWKSRFIFVSAAMLPESPLPRDLEAVIEDAVPTLSAAETRYGLLGDLPRLGVLSPWEVMRETLLMRRKVPLTFPLFNILIKVMMKPWRFVWLVKGRLQVLSRPLLLAISGKDSGVPVVRSSLLCRRLFPIFPMLGSKGSSQDPIEIPTGPSSSRVRDKASEVGIARFSSAFELSPSHATGTSKPTLLEGPTHRSHLAPLFADAIPLTYVPKWKVSHSSLIGTPEAARDFLTHVVPPSHKFVNSALRDDLFEDQYSMSLCESFFRGDGMLQRIDDLRRANEGLKAELKISQSVAAELRCQVVEAERKLQEEKGAGAMLEKKERAWEQEMAVLVEEKEELAAELKYLKEVGSVSQEELNTMYADYGVTSDDNQRLAKEKHWLITEGFEAFLAAVAQSEDFKSGLEEIYRAYRDVGYQAGLKDGYAYSAQGLGRKETPLYNSKAKKKLSKLDEEFGSKTPVILKKILEHPLISIDD
ncbi:hypothetical protein HanRHA438_Chr13g0598751 [Helianthus annuus]|nr:hypothetical protein HanRHA438_Chr13g0598751 [Helianthus annuus]